MSILASDVDPNVLESARTGVHHTTQTTDIAGEPDPLSDAEEFWVRDRV